MSIPLAVSKNVLLLLLLLLLLLSPFEFLAALLSLLACMYVDFFLGSVLGEPRSVCAFSKAYNSIILALLLHEHGMSTSCMSLHCFH